MNEGTNNHIGDVIVSKNGYDIIDCNVCGFKHAFPIPSTTELDKYYSDTFYSSDKPNYIQSHEKDLEWWHQIFEERIRLFNEHLQTDHKRILDIGSGPGFFLKYAQDNGWQSIGVEPSKHAAEFSRRMGLEIINVSFTENLVNGIGLYDVVHSNQTFEHLPYPIEALRLCFDLIRPGGLLFISVANDFNPIQEILTTTMDFDTWWVIPPEHINYFNVETLQRIVKKVEFEILQVTTTFPIDLFLLMGDNYIGNSEVGKKAHTRRKNLEYNLSRTGNLLFKKKLYKALSGCGIGREVELLAQKPIK